MVSNYKQALSEVWEILKYSEKSIIILISINLYSEY